MLMNTHEARLDALRQELKRQELDGFVIPISDEHMSEYVGGYAQRLAWLTGFGGSAGTAVVLTDANVSPAAAMFVDGRYTLQVRDQVDGRFYAYESVPQTSVAKWLGDHAPAGARIGYDPWLHSKGWVDTATKALAPRGGTLVATAHNPIDAVWDDRPAPSPAAALVHDERFAGQPHEAKRAAVSEWLATHKLDAAVVSALDSIAWLLNIRGSDVERTPVALSYVIAHADGTAELFIAEEKLTPELKQHLGNAVRTSPREAFVPALREFAGLRVAVDPSNAVQAIFGALGEAGAEIVELRDPTVLAKATKNPVEQAGHRAAQARDGAAVSRFLHWLSVEAPTGSIDELTAADRLQRFRAESGDLRDLSFDTISGSGPNGAIVHYRVSEETNRLLEADSVFLVDSGGQYPDGTTDITRTVWVGPGEPPAEVRDRFTRVLKGHIALAPCRLPHWHQWQPTRRAGAPVPLGRGARLRARHRPWRRQLPLCPRRPATHRQGRRRPGRHRAGAGRRHVPVERARLLQDRCLRHSHREPGAGRAARDRRGRRRLPRLRDADVGANRARAGRPRPARRGRAHLVERLSRAGARGDRPAA